MTTANVISMPINWSVDRKTLFSFRRSDKRDSLSWYCSVSPILIWLYFHPLTHFPLSICNYASVYSIAIKCFSSTAVSVIASGFALLNKLFINWFWMALMDTVLWYCQWSTFKKRIFMNYSKRHHQHLRSFHRRAEIWSCLYLSYIRSLLSLSIRNEFDILSNGHWLSLYQDEHTTANGDKSARIYRNQDAELWITLESHIPWASSSSSSLKENNNTERLGLCVCVWNEKLIIHSW